MLDDIRSHLIFPRTSQNRSGLRSNDHKHFFSILTPSLSCKWKKIQRRQRCPGYIVKNKPILTKMVVNWWFKLHASTSTSSWHEDSHFCAWLTHGYCHIDAQVSIVRKQLCDWRVKNQTVWVHDRRADSLVYGPWCRLPSQSASVSVKF